MPKSISKTLYTIMGYLLMLSMGIPLQPALGPAFKPQSKQESRAAIPHIITFFIERTEEIPVPPSSDHIIHTITRPGFPGYSFISNQLKPKNVQGVYALYKGWATHSDVNGQIMFPRGHDQGVITLVVTRSLQPVLISQNIIHHFIADIDEPVEYYHYDLQEAPHSKNPAWAVYKIQPPADRIIPTDAIVLIAQPEQIEIHEGYFPSFKSPNLILPTIYARPGLTTGTNALTFLRYNRYFAPVKFAWRHGTARYATIIVP